MVSYRMGAIAVGCLLGIVGGANAATLPTPSAEYAADRRIESEAGTFTGKVYSARDKERVEISLKGIQSVTILRRDRQIGWMLMPGHRMYSEIPLAMARRQSDGAALDEVTIEQVGTETLSGHVATKHKVLMKDGSAGGFIWTTQEGIAIKMDLLSKEDGKKSRITMTLTNLKIGPQDPELFELPAGFTAMPSMAKFGMGR